MSALPPIADVGRVGLDDLRDAKAVAEAVQHSHHALSVDQLDLQALHQARSRLAVQRTAD